MILLQTKIFNIFPGSSQTPSLVKILSSCCNRYTYEYILHRELWLNRRYFEISNSPEKKCLTIDMTHVNSLGPSKFSTSAKNDKKQIFYCNYSKKDRMFSRFLAIRKQTPAGEIIFSIVNLIDKSNKTKDIYYNISDKLSEIDNDRVQFKHRIREFNQSNVNSRQHELTTATTKHNAKEHDESAKSQDLFQNNNAIEKRSKAYTTTRIKSRNFLSNILYVGINKKDFYNENFIFNIYTSLVNNLNPFSLDRKLNDHNKHGMIYILWKECMTAKFYKFIISLEKNFISKWEKCTLSKSG